MSLGEVFAFCLKETKSFWESLLKCALGGIPGLEGVESAKKRWGYA